MTRKGRTMPELPEVETLCRQLQATIDGKKILATKIFDHKLVNIANVRGMRICGVCRRGKTIRMRLHDGRSIVIHLRMTGRLLWREDSGKDPHTRWRMTMADGNVDLVDPRRFATVTVVRDDEAPSSNDLMSRFDFRKFMQRQAPRRVSVKTLLMDPKAVAGIGNIYACEILHGAGISPARISSTLGEPEWRKIFSQARRVLKKAIARRGTSISDWRDLYGRAGENQTGLSVYGKEGEVCSRCGGIIVRIRQGGRSTFYCPQCQKEQGTGHGRQEDECRSQAGNRRLFTRR
ncbi:MAG: bifunctional DNA-formamidopyrimidine glycosylase/DNA-(apurinic or apyrimidinic site) lyase [Smithellaceae bacterium]|nr:bifunctional DNA-formamidopyrimidine glycosylase/DNA-(apurinic or apyrimidinic site) lyase [Smithellaceae bacterium]